MVSKTNIRNLSHKECNVKLIGSLPFELSCYYDRLHYTFMFRKPAHEYNGGGEEIKRKKKKKLIFFDFLPEPNFTVKSSFFLFFFSRFQKNVLEKEKLTREEQV